MFTPDREFESPSEAIEYCQQHAATYEQALDNVLAIVKANMEADEFGFASEVVCEAGTIQGPDYDSDDYDVKGMEVDARNGNFSHERASDYLHENIVLASFINGQFTQAKAQCKSYGMDYDMALYKFNQRFNK